LRAGANYSYLSRKIEDPLQPNLRPVGAPNHLGFAYLVWLPVPALSVQPSVELAGKRWTDQNGSAGLGYSRIGDYVLTNLQLGWQARDNVDAVVGARNLFDRNFELANGFPEPGRSLFAKLRVTF
jgi:iron complex outermembrane receptor protein